jgi:hypothetical protein
MALPSSGSLSIKNAAGAGRSIAQEVDGNLTGNKSLLTLSQAAGSGASDLYGVFDAGGGSSGSTADGVLYRYVPSTNTFTKLVVFDSPSDDTNGETGLHPSSIVQVGSEIYGTCYDQDGADGTLWKYNLSTSTFTLLFEFDSTVRKPYAIVHYSGKLYGLSDNNSLNRCIWQYIISTNSFSIIHNFTDSTDHNRMVLVGDKLYGTTRDGGTNNQGYIWTYNLTSMSYSGIVHNFAAINGWSVRGGLFYYNSKLYGVCYAGTVNNAGCIFSFDPALSQYSVVYSGFSSSSTNPRNPNSSVVIIDDIIYGTTDGGGTNLDGVFYKYNLSTSTFSVIENLDSATSGHIGSTEVGYANGYVFIQTLNGSADGDGRVSKYHIQSNTFSAAIIASQDIGASGYTRDTFEQPANSQMIAVNTSNPGGSTNSAPYGMLEFYGYGANLTTTVTFSTSSFLTSASGANYRTSSRAVYLNFTNAGSFGVQTFGVQIVRYLELYCTVSFQTQIASANRILPTSDPFYISSTGQFNFRTSFRTDSLIISSGTLVVYSLISHENAANTNSANAYAQVYIGSVWQQSPHNIVPTTASPYSYDVGFGLI